MSETLEPKPEKTEEESRTEVFDYAETAGLENIKFHVECAEAIAKESNTTLTILLAGGGAALGYTMKLLEAGGHAYLLGGTISVTIYIFVLAYTLVMRGMMVEDIEAPTNEPKNLMQPDFTLLAIREVEIENLQGRIKKNIQRNARKGLLLNRVRLAAIFVPILFAFGLTLGVIFGR